MLIDAGADIHAVERDIWSPLISAPAGGHLDVLRLLLDRGVEPDETPCA
jgi:hypothetical protein